MSTSLAKTKRRLRSVEGTRKLTKAMELIALAKLKKGLEGIEGGRYFLLEFQKALARLQKMAGEQGGNGVSAKGKRLIVFLGSDLGLCGPYNVDLGKQLLSVARPGDAIYPLGSHASSFVEKSGFAKAEGLPPLTLEASAESAFRFVEAALSAVAEGTYGEIGIVYSHYVNSLKNLPLYERVYPLAELASGKGSGEEIEPELDEDPQVLLERLLLPYLSSLLSARIRESTIAEYSARRTAMETANDNADELIQELNVLYNKERQNAITQEIVEVVGGSNV